MSRPPLRVRTALVAAALVALASAVADAAYTTHLDALTAAVDTTLAGSDSQPALGAGRKRHRVAALARRLHRDSSSLTGDLRTAVAAARAVERLPLGDGAILGGLSVALDGFEVEVRAEGDAVELELGAGRLEPEFAVLNLYVRALAKLGRAGVTLRPSRRARALLGAHRTLGAAWRKLTGQGGPPPTTTGGFLAGFPGAPDGDPLPGADFEGFAPKPEGTLGWPDLEPLGWVGYDVVRTRDAHTGAFAALGEVTGATVLPEVSVGPHHAGDDLGAGLPVTARTASVEGWVRLSLVGGDRFVVLATLTADGVEVGAADLETTQSVAGWTHFRATVVYTTADVPDWIRLRIGVVGPAHGGSPHVGSRMTLDDVWFSGEVPPADAQAQ